MSAGGDRTELGSRDDALLERHLDDLHRALGSLAISVKTCRRSNDNPVFRMSADQQFEGALAHATALLGLERVAHDDDSAGRCSAALSPLVQLADELTWSDARARLGALFQERATTLFAAERVKAEGRPCPALEELLARRATIPSVEAAPAAPLVADETALLYETTFTHGEGGAHHGVVGGLFVAYLVHARGVTEDEARRSMSPAALVGFAQSMEKGLAGYTGVVTFRIVRTGAKVEVQLRRLTRRADDPA